MTSQTWLTSIEFTVHSRLQLALLQSDNDLAYVSDAFCWLYTSGAISMQLYRNKSIRVIEYSGTSFRWMGAWMPLYVLWIHSYVWTPQSRHALPAPRLQAFFLPTMTHYPLSGVWIRRWIYDSFHMIQPFWIVTICTECYRRAQQTRTRVDRNAQKCPDFMT